MNCWVCECGKKVSEKLNVCPHCKSHRPGLTDIVPVASSSLKTMKITIGILVVVIIAGSFILYFRSNSKTSAEAKDEPPKPYYIVNQTTSSESTNQGGTKPPAQPAKTDKIVPQIAIDAVNALKKLEARTEVGISYKEYSPVLGETKYPIKLFLESSASKEFPELTGAVKSAFENYDWAHDVLKDKFSDFPDIKKIMNKNSYPYIFNKYPEAANKISNGGMLAEHNGEYLFAPDSMVSFLFSKAGDETKKASAMIAK